MNDIFGDEDPINIIVNELNHSRSLFKILSKTYEDNLCKSAKKSIKNIKDMEKYLNKISYDDLEKMIIEIKDLQKMRK